jgi:hypothetical protein
VPIPQESFGVQGIFEEMLSSSLANRSLFKFLSQMYSQGNGEFPSWLLSSSNLSQFDAHRPDSARFI